MHSRWIILAATLSAIFAPPARAQMFGPRSLGNTLSRRVGPGDAFSPLNANLGAQGDAFAPFGQGGTLGAQNGAGQLSGNERYLRGNRGAGSFVGATARDRRQRFVGTLQSNPAAAVRSAVADLRKPPERDINQGQAAAASSPAGMYAPRLSIDFTFTAPSADHLAVTLTRQLQESPEIRRRGPLEVSVAGQTAILRGEVASERDRVLAGLLVALEPGIWTVQNDLVIPAADHSDHSATPPSHPLSQPRDRATSR